MQRSTTRRANESRTRRTPRPALSPYFVDEIGMTMAEVIAARTGDRNGSGVN